MVCTFFDDEILRFLDCIVDTNSFRKIDGECQRNIEVFNGLADEVNHRLGLEDGKKNGSQWRTKWKKLKSKYFKERITAAKPG